MLQNYEIFSIIVSIIDPKSYKFVNVDKSGNFTRVFAAFLLKFCHINVSILMKSVKSIGILRETKTPRDKRSAFTPKQVSGIILYHHIPIKVQPDPVRGYSDEEFNQAGAVISEDISDCDLLMGVKEVMPDKLIEGKTYMFFSHTAKKQPHNKKLLQTILEKKNTLIDYEYLVDEKKNRLVAFGRWAGIVGAYKALRAAGIKTGGYNLKPAFENDDYNELREQLTRVQLPPVKIVVTGGGRVAGGVMEVMETARIKEVDPEDFTIRDFYEPVACRLDPWHYTKRVDGSDFVLQHFFQNPEMYESTFKPFTKVSDIFIAAHFWDPSSPAFFTRKDMLDKNFRISLVADISCDIPGPIPSTVRASKFDNPFYGYDPISGKEIPPFQLGKITVMAVDNLPGELPRNASEEFGEQLLKIIPDLTSAPESEIIKRATIAKEGKLTPNFSYLREFANE
ncbi:MAG: NAD(P)-dependent oxidoreductase [Bacteroidota bacterium]